MRGRRGQIAVVAGLVLLAANLAGCDDAQKPGARDISARPGTVVVVGFRQPVEGAPKKALASVPSNPIVKPSPLPEGATVIHDSFFLGGSGNVSGDLLLLIPPEASGDIALTLAASGRGAGRAGSGVSFKTGAVDVKIAVSGAPPDSNPPKLAGTWKKNDQSWTFDGKQRPTLRIRHAPGEEKAIRYQLYRDGKDRWFLVENRKGGTAYWLALNGEGKLVVDHPGTDFKPFATLSRE